MLREVRRIESMARGTPDSVSHHANPLLTFFEAKSYAGGPAPKLSPSFSKGYELPLDLRLGLGCLIKEKQPIPAEWALRWAYLEPTIYLRTAASRCPDQFETAFRYLYAQKYGDGLVIKANKTILSISYQPTWTGGNDSPVRLDFSDTPDVKTLTAPQNTLKELVEQATALVDPYSRFLGPSATKAGTLEAMLTLPSFLWADDAKARFDEFRRSMVHPVAISTCEVVFTALGSRDEVTPTRVMELARSLHRFEIGFEPDVLSGARRPKAGDPVVLFSLSIDPEEERKSVSYQTALLFVATAAVLTLADGYASDVEASALDQILSKWDGLSSNHRLRLGAYYRLCLRQPPTSASLKTRLESLDAEDRKQLGTSLSLLAASDGVVSPQEVRLLERFYKMMALETQELYSDLHGAAGRSPQGLVSPPVTASGNNHTFLDASRIGHLRRESNEVSQLLAQVFEEQPQVVQLLPEPPTPVAASVAVNPPSVELRLPTLTGTDQRFLTLLLTRAEWPREELLGQTAEMQIMLDGALERINEAALDHLGDILVEGEDPIFVQQTLLETAE